MKKLMIFIGTLTLSFIVAATAYSELRGDLNGDGVVDGNDLSIFSEDYGKAEIDCVDNEYCRPGYYCKKAPGDCEGKGVCSPRPDACIQIYDPVCGCDGNTYGNECVAAAAGVNVAYKGECSDVGCVNNDNCPLGHYCKKVPGDCNGKGVCSPRPDACLDIYDPVCGCDGKTYGNECVAAMAGVNVAFKGECRDTHCDDGSAPLCLMIPPICTEHEILAIQNNCWVCVNPATCRPWGEPGCENESEGSNGCPEGFYCDPCGTSSCPFCDDCVPACVLK
jgi:hypothetical protein